MKKCIALILLFFLSTSQAIFGARKSGTKTKKHQKMSDEKSVTGQNLNLIGLFQDLNFLSHFELTKAQRNEVHELLNQYSKKDVQTIFWQAAWGGHDGVLEVILMSAADTKSPHHASINTQLISEALGHAMFNCYQDIVKLLTTNDYALSFLTAGILAVAVDSLLQASRDSRLSQNTRDHCKETNQLLVTCARKKFSDEVLEEACEKHVKDQHRDEVKKNLLNDKYNSCIIL